MRPLTKEELHQAAEQAWNNYLASESMLTPAKIFFEGYKACYAKCLGWQHDELVGMLDEVGNAIQSLHNEAVKDFIVSQIEPKPKFNIGDKVFWKSKGKVVEIHKILENKYYLFNEDGSKGCRVDEQDNELIPAIDPIFKVGDEIQDDCNAFVVIKVELDRQRYKTIYKCMAGTDAGISVPHYISFKEQSNYTLVKHAPKYHKGQYVKWCGGIFPVRSINETHGSYFYYLGAMDSYVDEGQLSPVTESDIKCFAVE